MNERKEFFFVEELVDKVETRETIKNRRIEVGLFR